MFWKRENAQLIALRDFLTRQGYQVDTQSGSLVFSSEGLTYAVLPDDQDPQFVQILFPKFWVCRSSEEQSFAYRAAVTASADTKAEKIILLDANVSAVAEMFSSSAENTQAIFFRVLSTLRSAAGRFQDEMNRAGFR